jgi:site-specific DNA-cytosine methylase
MPISGERSPARTNAKRKDLQLVQSEPMSGGTFYEFFAGGGMARAGLGKGWKCLLANDFDPKKQASYCENWGKDEFHPGSVSDISTEKLPGRADLAWASFPCQDLSLAGSGAGLKGHPIRHVLAFLGID